MAKKTFVQIVIALVEQTTVPVQGKWTTSRGDGINSVAALQTVAIAQACMWKRRGTEADIAKATEYAASGGFVVFTYPTSERKPLEAAKAAALALINPR
jgi:hypothetical protein